MIITLILKAIEAEVNVHYTDLLSDGDTQYQYLLARQLLKIQVNVLTDVGVFDKIIRCASIHWRLPTHLIAGRHLCHYPCSLGNTGVFIIICLI